MMKLLRQWYQFGQRVEDKIVDGLEKKAKFIARHPVAWIVVFCCIAAVCGVGLLNLKTIVETDAMFVPENSEAEQDLNSLESKFGLKNRGGPVLYTASAEIGNNLLNLEAFETMWDVHEKIINTIQADNMSYTDLCFLRETASRKCMVYGILQFFRGNRTLYNNQVKTVQQLSARLSAPRFPDGSIVLRDQIFGNLTLNPSSPFNIISFSAATEYFFIVKDNLDTARSWERKMFDAVDDTSVSQVTVTRTTASAYDDAVTASVAENTPSLIAMYVIFIGLTIICLCSGVSLAKTRIGLSITGLLLLILALVAGAGICAGLGVRFMFVLAMVPFVVACVGVHNMVTIVAAFDAQDVSLSVEERMGLTMRRCGKEIMYTAVVTSVAFYLGTMSQMAAVRAVCFYSGTALFANYVCQVNIFAAALSIDAHRSAGNRLDIFCCLTSSTGSSSGVVVPVDETNDHKTSQVAPTHSSGIIGDPAIAKYAQIDDHAPEEEGQSATSGAGSRTSAVGPLTVKPTSVNPRIKPQSEMGYLEYFFSELYFPLFKHPLVRLFLFCGMCGMLVANIFGIMTLNLAFEPTDVLSKSSGVRDYMLTARSFGLLASEQSSPAEIILPDLPYHNQTIQEEIFRLQSRFLNQSDENKGPMASWLTGFYLWVRAIPAPVRPPLNSHGYCTRKDVFYLSVKKFVDSAAGSMFKKDLVFMNSTEGTPIRIRSSRITSFHKSLHGPVNITRTMRHTRNIVAESEFQSAMPFADASSEDAFVFSTPYIKGEGFKVAVEEFIRVIIAALVGVAGVSMVMLKPHGLFVVLVATLTAAGTYVDIVGNFAWWGWKIDISFFSIVMITSSIALISGYVLPVFHHYHSQSVDVDPLERLKVTLVETGPSTLSACLIAAVAIIPMAFSQSYIFKLFFRVYFCVIFYSLGHALVLLPSILPTLSLVACESCAGHKEDSEKDTGIEMNSKSAADDPDGPVADRVQPFVEGNV